MKTNVGQIIFQGINDVRFAEATRSIDPSPDGAVLATRYSCVSPGTELAKLTGLQKIKFPTCLGNRSIGRVIEVGPDCRRLKVGDLAFSHTAHASHVEAAKFTVKIPDSLDRPESALLGMAMVAITGLQQLESSLGDIAVVTGAGLVGQFAAQLLELSGITAVLVDPVEGRLKVATTCGVSHTSTPDQALETVLGLTDGRGADHLLECTGVPAVAEGAPEFLRRSGTMVFVGSPRGEHMTDLTPFLNHVHLNRPHGDLTLRGAHEWRIPSYSDGFHRHTMERNMGILARLLDSERLKAKELLTHIVKPAHAAEGYESLKNQSGTTMGVVFDWS